MKSMQFQTPDGMIDVAVKRAIIAGWTGRDQSAVQHHIDELAEIGVAPPSEVPLFYRVSHDLLSQNSRIEVLGEESSGEVEPVLIHHGGELWLGLGSDHTDRALETSSVAASKQACAKPIAQKVWRFADVAARLDELALRCEIEEEGRWTVYQQGSLSQILPLDDLAFRAQLQDEDVMFCGTLPAIGGVRPAFRYRMSLRDPATKESILLEYGVLTMPIVS